VIRIGPAEQLLELEALRQLKSRYFRLLDTKQWDDMRLQFTDDCVYEGTSAPFPDADAFIAAMKVNHARTRTVHHGHMPELVLQSDTTARGIWAMTDYVTWDGPSPLTRSTIREDQWGFLGFGYYQEEYRKEDGLWKIARLRLTRLRVDMLVGEPAQITPNMLGPQLDWLPPR
jgi:SnoaL-like domain